MDRTAIDPFKDRRDGVKVSLADTDEFLTVEECCELLKYGRNAVYSLLRSGELRSFKNGRVWRIPKAAISEYVRDHT